MTAFWKKCCEAYRHPSLKLVRRVIVGVVGGTVLLIGVALIVLPGPAFLVIPLGLAILASEFLWAKHLLHKAKGMFKRSNKSGAVKKTKNLVEEATTGKQ